MGRYIDEQGNPVDATSPRRLIWHSINFEQCGYVTDDFDKLGTLGMSGIPCCPYCKRPGLQTSAKEWEASAVAYDAEVCPGYLNWLRDTKEKCRTREVFSLAPTKLFPERN